MIDSHLTILWAQNVNPNISPTVLVNGRPVEGEEAQQAFNELCVANQKLELPEIARESMCKRAQRTGNFFSRQANYATLKNGKGIYLQGCYLDEDERGRKLPYMFLIKGTNSIAEAFDKLKEVSSSLNRSCNDYEIIRIHRSSEPSIRKRIGDILDSNSKKKTVNIIFLVLLAILLWMILILIS